MTSERIVDVVEAGPVPLEVLRASCPETFLRHGHAHLLAGLIIEGKEQYALQYTGNEGVWTCYICGWKFATARIFDIDEHGQEIVKGANLRDR